MIILKILLWIILAVLGIILLFLILPFNADLSYIDNKFNYKVRCWFITVYSSDGKNLLSKFKKRKKKSENTDFYDDSELDTDILVTENYEEDDISFMEDIEEENSQEEISGTDNIEEISEKTEKKPDNRKKSGKSKKVQSSESEKVSDGKIEFLFDLIRSAGRPFLKLCKGIKLSQIYIDFVVADEDAYKCALNYGKISGTVYNILGWLSVIFSVKFRTVDVIPDFRSNESRWDISAKVSFRLITLVIAGIYFLITYIFRFLIPEKRQRKELKKKRGLY